MNKLYTIRYYINDKSFQNVIIFNHYYFASLRKRHKVIRINKSTFGKTALKN